MTTIKIDSSKLNKQKIQTAQKIMWWMCTFCKTYCNQSGMQTKHWFCKVGVRLYR